MITVAPMPPILQSLSNGWGINMSALNVVNIDVIENIPTLTSMTVAKHITDGEITPEKLRKKNRHIRDMIKKNLSDFEEFGKVRFQNAPSLNSSTNQTIQIVLLNEEQYFLLMTYQRNTKKVREFKMNATRAFFAMKKKLSGESVGALPQTDQLKEQIDERLNDFEKKFEDFRLGSHHTSMALSHSIRVVTSAEKTIQNLPLDSDQLKFIRTTITEYGRLRAEQLGISSETAIPALFIKLNKYFDVNSYHEIPRSSFFHATQFIRTVEL